MNNNEYLSVSQYAEIKGVSKQAVYKQLNNKLKPFLIVVDGKKYIDKAVLTEGDNPQLNNQQPTVEQQVEQPATNQIQLLLEKQLAEKDTTIQSLLRQIENLQEQNSKLTDLLHNSQVLLAVEKKLYLEQETETSKEKKGFFGIFKKKAKESP